jgi:hypothetical protein
MADRHGMTWEPSEDARLRALWGEVDVYYLARRLGRTVIAVRERARLLGLPRGVAPGYLSLSEAARRAGYYDRSYVRALAWWRSRGGQVDAKRLPAVVGTRRRGLWTQIEATDAADIAAAYAQSELPGQASARLGVTPWTLARWAKTAGYTSAPMLRLMPEEWDALVASQPKKRGPTE